MMERLERPQIEPEPPSERPTSASRTTTVRSSAFDAEAAAAVAPSAVAPPAKLRLNTDAAYLNSSLAWATPGSN